jgi:hypothetical protein
VTLCVVVTGCFSEPYDQENDTSVDAAHDAADVGVDPGTEPVPDPGYDPGTDPGYDPGTDPGYDPGVDPGHDPGTDPGYDPGTDPGYDPGVDPGHDPGTDPGPDGIVGDPCSTSGDCGGVPGAGRLCLTNLMGMLEFPGGYCSADCTSSSECGTQGDCIDIGGFTYCAKRCTSASECRTGEGYSCVPPPGSSTGTYCLPTFPSPEHSGGFYGPFWPRVVIAH